MYQNNESLSICSGTIFGSDGVVVVQSVAVWLIMPVHLLVCSLVTMMWEFTPPSTDTLNEYWLRQLKAY